METVGSLCRGNHVGSPVLVAPLLQLHHFSSAIKDQLNYNKKIEPQLAQLVAALSFATNLEKINAITTRGGKSTRDPPYPTRIGKTPAVVQEEKKDDEVEEVEPQAQEIMQDFHDTTFLPFPRKNRKDKMNNAMKEVNMDNYRFYLQAGFGILIYNFE